jgi:hypothetical protein
MDGYISSRQFLPFTKRMPSLSKMEIFRTLANFMHTYYRASKGQEMLNRSLNKINPFIQITLDEQLLLLSHQQ